jgi:hypothetical protein
MQVTSLFVLFLCAVAFCTSHATTNASISLTPLVIDRNGDMATITWSVPSFTSTDLLAIFIDSGAEQPAFHYAVSAASGSMQVRMINILHGFRVCYLADGDFRKKTVCSNWGKFAMAGEPLYPRVSLAKDGSRVVMWTVDTTDFVPVLGYRDAACGTCSFTMVDYSEIRHYTIQDMCGAPANTSEGWVNPGFQVIVTLPLHATSTAIEYRLGDKKRGLQTPSYTLRPTENPSAVSLVMFGDMGVSVNQTNHNFENAELVTQAIEGYRVNHAIDMVFHIGDIAYGMGLEITWPLFQDRISSLASNFPWMTAIGNHESCWPTQDFHPPGADYGSDSGGECGIVYSSRLAMPAAGPKEPWYAFNFGPVHFVVLSSEHDFLPNSTQYDFVQSDLASVDRSLTPWVIVGSHRPMYTAAENVSQAEGPLFWLQRKTFEPLMLEYQVDIVFTAHIHFYERSCRLVDYVCHEDKGPVYVVAGMAGAPITPLPPAPLPVWTANMQARAGFVAVDATEKELKWSFIGIDGQVYDSLVLTK